MSVQMISLRNILLNGASRSLGAKTTIMPMTRQVRHLTNIGHVKTSNFSLKGMRKHYAVLPLVGIIVSAVTGICGFVFYASQTRDNVVYRKTTKSLSESMDLLNPQTLKIKTINQKYQPLPEVAALYKDMEEAETEAKSAKKE